MRIKKSGHRQKLVKALIDYYPEGEISAQVSSLSSLKVFRDLGFRVTEAPNSSFEEAEAIFKENGGSLNLRINSPALDAPEADSAPEPKVDLEEVTPQEELMPESAPDGYYETDRGEFFPEGANSNVESGNFTDDPEELAQRYDEKEITDALTEAVQGWHRWRACLPL